MGADETLFTAPAGELDDAFEHDEPQINLRTAKVLGLDLPAASGLDISTQSSLQGRN